MTTSETTLRRSNGHGTQQVECPYCGQSISRKEFKAIQARIEGEERARIADVEQALKDKFAREATKAEAQAKVAVEKARREGAKAAEAHARALKSSTETMIAARLEAQRIQLERTTTQTVNAERAKMYGEKLKLEEQLADMQRRLQAQTAHQLGEPAEVDLFKALELAFPDDRISRVVKGQKGPDVIVEVVHQDAVVGSIVLDSKNHARWSNKFTTKLRSDQLGRGADFAILSSSVFPPRSQQLHIQDNVIVASPQRVVVLVHLLRRQIVENYRFKLSAEARTEKADRLYEFVISPACTDLFDRIVKLTADMVDLDRTETATHQKTWAKRGELIRTVQEVHNQISEAVSAIIEPDPL